MAEHDFTLMLHGDVQAHVDELYELGCDDATFGAVDGVSYAEFTREAPTFAHAVQSAIAAVEALDELRVVQVEPRRSRQRQRGRRAPSGARITPSTG